MVRLSSRTAALVTAAAIAGSLSACAASEPAKPTSQPAPTTTEASKLTETPWHRFSDERFPHTFELPDGWTTEEVPTTYAEYGLYQFSVLDPDGQAQLTFSTQVTGLGGACTGAYEDLDPQELDSQPLGLVGYVPAAQDASLPPLTPPHFAYRASQLDGRVVTSIGVDNQTPPTYCFYYNLLATETGSVLFADRLQVSSAPAGDPADEPREFATMDEARAFMQTEEYRTLKRIFTSLQLG